MSTSSIKKFRSPGSSQTEAGGSPPSDPLTLGRLGGILAAVAVLVSVMMLLEAERNGLWREFWVSAVQVWIASAALFVLLRPRA